VLPRITHDHRIKIFNFVFDGKTHQGMNYEGELYRLIDTFDADARIHAHALGCKLCSKKIRAVITVSEQGQCRVWAQMPANAILEPLPLDEPTDGQVSKTLLISD
jgi:hypothetical protein